MSELKPEHYAELLSALNNASNGNQFPADCQEVLMKVLPEWVAKNHRPSNLEPLDEGRVYGEQYLVKDDVKQPLYSCRASLLVAKISKELNIADWIVRKKCLGLIQEFFDAIINQYYLFSPSQFGRKEVPLRLPERDKIIQELTKIARGNIVVLIDRAADYILSLREVPLRLPEPKHPCGTYERVGWCEGYNDAINDVKALNSSHKIIKGGLNDEKE